MKKTNFLFLIIIIFSCFLFSCERENLETSDSIILNSSFNGPILATYSNGRLNFNTESDLQTTIKNLKSFDNDNDIINSFKEFYNDGFIPTYPFYSENDSISTVNFLNDRDKYTPNFYNTIEKQLEDVLVSDDIFASLLNSKREIQVGSFIYAYTFSGLYIVDKKNYSKLVSFIDDNNIYNTIPDPFSLTTGVKQITDNINRYVSPLLNLDNLCNNQGPVEYDNGPGPINRIFCNTNTGPTGGNTTPSIPQNYTSSMLDYVEGISACNIDDAGIFDGWTPFGTRKECKERFTGDNRETRSLYSNESYLIHSAINIKVKHRRRHSVFGTVWWAAKKTNEVAVIIDQATFKISSPNIQAPIPNFNITSNNPNKMIFFTGDLVVGKNVSGAYESYPNLAHLVPSTPFDEDVIVEFFNDNISINSSMDITADEVNNLFYSQVYDRAKNIFNNQTGSDPTRITTLFVSPEATILHYVDLGKRKLNTKKIKETLAQNWAGEISITVPVDGGNNNNIVTYPDVIASSPMVPYSGPQNDGNNFPVNFSFSPGELINYDDIYLNFTGLSRRDSEWRGSKMVYRASQ